LDERPEVGAVLPELMLLLEVEALADVCALPEPPPELTCEDCELPLNETELL